MLHIDFVSILFADLPFVDDSLPVVAACTSFALKMHWVLSSSGFKAAQISSKLEKGSGRSGSKGTLKEGRSFRSLSSRSTLKMMFLCLGIFSTPAANGAVPPYTWTPGTLRSSAIVDAWMDAASDLIDKLVVLGLPSCWGVGRRGHCKPVSRGRKRIAGKVASSASCRSLAEGTGAENARQTEMDKMAPAEDG